MPQTTASPPDPLDSIPDPERILDRLATLFAEARLLRRLLRVSQAAYTRQRPPACTDPDRATTQRRD